MFVQVNSNHSVNAGDLEDYVETELKSSLGHHADRITRIEVHFNDVNAEKGGDTDKRCLIEARLMNRRPEATEARAADVATAFQGALSKLMKVLDKIEGRLGDKKGAETIRGSEGI